jgi:nucleoside-diphosphate-sugar epimerase
VEDAVLITGASGFVGAALAERLERNGRKVRRSVRQARRPGDVATGDIGPDTDWSEAVAGVDAVVHCAARAHVLREEISDPLSAFRAVNRDGTLALARAAARAGARRFVFVSSIGVNGGTTDGRPFAPSDVPHPHTPYGVSKWEAEQGLAAIATETGMEVVVVRPPLVIGPGAKGNLGTIAGLIRRGLPIPLGGITQNKRDLVSLPVLVDLLALCVDHPSAAGQLLLVADGVTRSTAGIVRAVMAAEGVSGRMLPVPAAWLGAALSAIGRTAMREQLLGDLEVDIGATRNVLGWQPDAASIF